MSTRRKRLLVANRGEIACRIFQACREMGIKPVALLAPGDEQARHITYADQVLEIPSYLDVKAIVKAAKEAEIDFIHPGYGFLSERPVFVEAVEKAGISFLGPRAETMELLGGKIAAKELAQKAGVPTLPWAKVKTLAEIKKAATQVGFPLLLKASAGGGGKGMRRVDREEQLEEAAESASAEAISAFGDGTLFIERLVDQPRHIEVQVFGDGLGGALHLQERECSLQRRHQKIWEEAPAIHLPDATRQGLFESALNLVKATKYRSAGTVEFLVDSKGAHYFLEMNTRLQVEHPVSELITGTDLVRAQIFLALEEKTQKKTSSLSQGKLPGHPSTPELRGHAIEVRLYAEDPAQGFVPAPGKILKIHWPSGPGIRVDSGIEEGQTITTLFDSMLAKIIVWGVDRDHALARMRTALDDTVVFGVGSNQAYLRLLCDETAVKEGKVDTDFLNRVTPEFTDRPCKDGLSCLVAAHEKQISSLSTSMDFGGVSNSETSKYPSPWFHSSQEGGAL